MWERTITVGSAGKTFGVTGWRVGWLIGPAEILKVVTAIHARSVFCVPTPLQAAVATGLEKCLTLDYFEEQRARYKRLRDKMAKIFTDLGLPVAITQGSYFMMVNTERLKFDAKPVTWVEKTTGELEPHDYTVCRWLTTEIGVTAIPPSSFYDSKNIDLAKNLARFCFCKSDETLEDAEKRLAKLSKFLK